MQICGFIVAMPLGGTAAVHPAELPPPAPAPLAIDFSRDPVLSLEGREAGWPMLRTAVNGAIERQPGIGEHAATEYEARAVLRQGREQQLPSADIRRCARVKAKGADTEGLIRL